MSGTSGDGIDAVVAAFEGARWCGVVARVHRAYPAAIRAAVIGLGVDPAAVSLRGLAELDARIGECFAAAAAAAIAVSGLPRTAFDAIGSHGQTVLHQPHGRWRTSFQLGDPNRIAAACGMPVVADFRRMDLALGGQGAPLVPAFHRAVFYRRGEPRGVVNIGGIANFTLVPGDAHAPVRGCDLGPGNALMDEWAQQQLGRRYDHDGRLAAAGRVHAPLLDALLADPFFARKPPKSSGRDYFNLAWAKRRYPSLARMNPADVQATFCALTAHAIARAATAGRVRRLLICGGGAYNPVLMRSLREQVPAPVLPTDAYGLPARDVEAAAFAWLAMRAMRGLPGNLPAVTGAKTAAVLGGVYRPR